MFVVASQRLFWWPVTVSIPHPTEAGRQEKHTFDMQFRALPQDEARRIDEERNALPEDEQAARMFDFIHQVAVGWRDVVAEDKTDVPFSRELLEQQLQFPWFRDGILRAYEEAVTGGEARLGNSAAPRVH
ncbi:hypothetical protein [Methylobacterium aquaticum]|jgi:hypothetical protein|uniref:Uncharacterized protein n=1 Tax=Methylobacterium aquaticum TaxID=270351 RepID=A0A0J6VKG2_9HYPH|nr:hypothetical protein [Methylobacterium aquaticum]KMO39611.1 hypothetical protein VP06_03845 [Methylobacterium aquaticum]